MCVDDASENDKEWIVDRAKYIYSPSGHLRTTPQIIDFPIRARTSTPGDCRGVAAEQDDVFARMETVLNVARDEMVDFPTTLD